MKKIFLLLLFLTAASFGPIFGQKIAVKSNLLYDATATINLGVEVGIAEKWTLDASFNYNGWTFSNNHKIKHLLVQPDFHWWLNDRFRGHFLGIHLHAGQFNIGGMLPWGIKNNYLSNKRLEGSLFGGGVGYGYQWNLWKGWNLEASFGVGYAYIKYDTFRCVRCGDKYKKGSTMNYVGPTKAAVSLVYVF